jgi:hypothetical protein
MADDKRGREKQSRDADNRQRARELLAELERAEETEPPVDEAQLDALEADLADVEFPATGAAVVTAVGDRSVEAGGDTYAIADLVPETETEWFGGRRAVRLRIRRPTVATAMKRIVEAVDGLRNAELTDSQRTAYEKTLRALEAIEEDDENEGVRVVADWVVEQVREDETIPESRAVRRRAAEFCRANGYPVESDDWLGV